MRGLSGIRYSLAAVVAIAVGLAMLAIAAVALVNQAGATAEPFACTVVEGNDEAVKHAIAEARFHSMPEWDKRHPGFRRDFSEGVDVQLSYVRSPRLHLAWHAMNALGG